MLKVVHINHSDFGGAAIAAVRLHKGMLSSGIQSKFLTYAKTRNDFPEHYIINEITCSRFSSMARIKQFVKRVFRKLGVIPDYEKKHLANRPPDFELFTFPFPDFDLSMHPLVQEADVIHLHWVARGFLDYTLFFKNTQFKVVWTFHDMNPFTGGCHHADECCGFQGNCYPCPQLKNTIDESIAQKVLSIKIKAIQSFPVNNLIPVTPSHWLRELALNSVVFKNLKIQQIPNGIDSQVFKTIFKTDARAALQLPQHAKIILFTSLDIENPRKGMKQLVQALNNMERIKDVVICTMGHARSNDFPNAISLGYIFDEHQLALAYSAADVFVLPSIAENFPNSICESLFCGTPVVAYRTGGIPEQVNKNNGLLVTTGAVKELSSAIGDILQHPEKYNAGLIRQEAINKYALEIVVSQYKLLYKQLTNQEF